MPAHAAPHIAKQWGPPASPISNAVKAKVVFMDEILDTQDQHLITDYLPAQIVLYLSSSYLLSEQFFYALDNSLSINLFF